MKYLMLFFVFMSFPCFSEQCSDQTNKEDEMFRNMILVNDFKAVLKILESIKHDISPKDYTRLYNAISDLEWHVFNKDPLTPWDPIYDFP